MKTLVNAKKDLDFNTSLTALIEILKNIAAAQFRTMERRLKTFEQLDSAIRDFFDIIPTQELKHPFLQPKNKMQLVAAVTSDTGLLGGLNSRIITAALAELEKIPGKLITIGERGKLHAQTLGIPVISFSGVIDEQRYSQAIQLRDYIIDKFYEDEAGYIKIVYAHPVSFTVQRIETVTFVPYIPQEKRGAAELSVSDIIWESHPADIVEYLIYIWMGQRIYDIFGLSRLAEFGARFGHLEESTQKLKDMKKKLDLDYHRIKHEVIDRDMRDLFSSRLMYAGK